MRRTKSQYSDCNECQFVDIIPSSPILFYSFHEKCFHIILFSLLLNILAIWDDISTLMIYLNFFKESLSHDWHVYFTSLLPVMRTEDRTVSKSSYRLLERLLFQELLLSFWQKLQQAWGKVQPELINNLPLRIRGYHSANFRNNRSGWYSRKCHSSCSELIFLAFLLRLSISEMAI